MTWFEFHEGALLCLTWWRGARRLRARGCFVGARSWTEASAARVLPAEMTSFMRMMKDKRGLLLDKNSNPILQVHKEL